MSPNKILIGGPDAVVLERTIILGRCMLHTLTVLECDVKQIVCLLIMWWASLYSNLAI